MNTEDPFRTEIGTITDDLRSGLVFLTRLPAAWIGGTPPAPPNFRRGARVFPVVGAMIGLAGGAVYVVAAWLGEPPLISATLATLATMLMTSGLHEDGLADTVDGFGGGSTTERKLEIMDDSRIGAYGGAALIFSILFRVAALASLGAGHPVRAALVLIAAEAISRAAMVRLWHALPAARLSGLAHDTGPPDQSAMLVALAFGGGIALVAVWPSFGLAAAIIGILCSIAATYMFIRINARAIGGRTGDTLGACQQIAAISFLLGVVAAA